MLKLALALNVTLVSVLLLTSGKSPDVPSNDSDVDDGHMTCCIDATLAREYAKKLVDLKVEYHGMRVYYSDEHAPNQKLLSQIQFIENELNDMRTD